MEYLELNQDKLGVVARELNRSLANYHIYYQNLRNFHWNIVGENFFELHELFEELYNDARQQIDDIAERILTIGYRPISRLSDYLELADLKEATANVQDREMVTTILEQQRIMLTQMQRTIGYAREANDNGTIYLMSKYVSKLEKQNWMLKSWLRPVYTQQSASAN